ncbi:MAG TPA: Do family serine endopeptidase [Dongiaceae bacterium]|nr:Do family serine endopeptidase [Dongiaceae bacterium]
MQSFNPKGKTRVRLLAGAAVATVLGLGAVAALPTVSPADTTPTATAAPFIAGAPSTFADLAAKVSPAVVNVSSTHVMTQQEQGGQQMPFDFPEGSPFDQFFKQFQQQQRQQQKHPQKVTSLGSGFIIDASGYVVTNNHVVDGAKDIEVTLTDGAVYPAKVIGTDAKTDLALLKVEAKKPLPFVSFGNSDKMRIGDWVMAVGNPFGLGGTVTAGIVSARGRDIHEGPYDDFLQIDAAINQGNSGGPTFSTDGSVIGINTAIFSPSGGSVGIGFAIPSNLAKPIIAELKDQGHIDRGWLGVSIQPLTPELTQGMNLGSDKGALISSIQDNSPAAAAGLKSGDVVTRFGDHEIESPKDLSRAVAETASGASVPVKVWRDGSEKTISVKIAEMKEEVASADPSEQGGEPSASDTVDQLGATLAPVNDMTRQQFGLSEDAKGVVIADLEQDSALAEQGVRPGDVIERVNDRKIANPADVAKALQETQADKRSVAVMLIESDGNDRFVAVQIKS